MTNRVPLAAIVPLIAALLLAGCGGGSIPAARSAFDVTRPAPGVVVPAPAPDTQAFVALARSQDCAATRNRLFLIDQKFVFWDRADSACYDASYARQLFGATPQTVLCANGDSIAGPMTSCTDEKYRAMFDTILKNLDDANLGLGGSSKVEAIPFLPKDGSALAFEPIAGDAASGVHSAKNVVVKDVAGWEKLWAEHTGNRMPAPAMPKIDFDQQMLLGVFLGDGPSGCRQVGVIRVGVRAGKIAVDVEERDAAPGSFCVAALGSPMNVVAVARGDAPVEFATVKPVQLAFTSIESSRRSNVVVARTDVIKDAVSWAALWSKHAANGAPAPAVDFSTNMVVAVFAGARPNGCYSTGIGAVYRVGNTINVARVDAVPGAGVICTQAIVTPAHMVQLARSDDPVEFGWQLKPIK
ncbi:MAG: protease complex subunit PrcB family protein [Telluria sp.]